MGEVLGVLVCKISFLRQKLVIIFATLVFLGANLGVLAFKISILRQKLVIFCATCTRAILSVLACKSVFQVKN